ncbi:MAG TPA: inorganic diphosphatase [Candidatus Koribacter sp.]|jgi:inorganic pyrophosphatase
MAKKAHQDLTKLPSYDAKEKKLVNVIVETPRGSRNKFAYDPDLLIFRLKKVLPAGMEFPYDFGFVPSTKAPDGDPLDVLLLMDESAHPGTLMRCRLIGIFEGEQTEGGKKERNDRVLAVSEHSMQYAHVKDIDDLDKKILKSLQDFFVNYHELEKVKFKLLACKRSKDAYRAVEKTRRRSK